MDFIDLCRVNGNYYNIVIIKIFKILNFSHRICAENGKVDTGKKVKILFLT